MATELTGVVAKAVAEGWVGSGQVAPCITVAAAAAVEAAALAAGAAWVVAVVLEVVSACTEVSTSSNTD